MIIEVSFGLAGGLNFALEKSWQVIEDIIKKYPGATWKKIINRNNNQGKYVVEIN